MGRAARSGRSRSRRISVHARHSDGAKTHRATVEKDDRRAAEFPSVLESIYPPCYLCAKPVTRGPVQMDMEGRDVPAVGSESHLRGVYGGSTSATVHGKCA